MQILDLNDGRLAQLSTIKGYKEPIVDLKCCPDNFNTFYICSEAGSIELWDIRDIKKPSLRFIGWHVKCFITLYSKCLCLRYN